MRVSGGLARLACFNSGHRIEDHFVDVTEMVEIGSDGLIDGANRLFLRKP